MYTPPQERLEFLVGYTSGSPSGPGSGGPKP